MIPFMALPEFNLPFQGFFGCKSHAILVAVFGGWDILGGSAGVEKHRIFKEFQSTHIQIPAT